LQEVYYYFLEEIEVTGSSNQHGPIRQNSGYGNLMNFALGVILIGGAGVIIWSILKMDREKAKEANEI
jgi:hypothetical protein